MGLIDRFLARTKADRSDVGAMLWGSGEKAFVRAERVVQDYGAAMRAKRSLGSGCVADTRDLPHSKERIKQALVLLLRDTQEPQFREQLKSSYLLLADWQQDVGDMAVAVPADCDAIRCGTSASTTALKEPASASAAWQTWERWRSKVLEEERALKAELQQLGLW